MTPAKPGFTRATLLFWLCHTNNLLIQLVKRLGFIIAVLAKNLKSAAKEAEEYYIDFFDLLCYYVDHTYIISIW